MVESMAAWAPYCRSQLEWIDGRLESAHLANVALGPAQLALDDVVEKALDDVLKIFLQHARFDVNQVLQRIHLCVIEEMPS